MTSIIKGCVNTAVAEAGGKAVELGEGVFTRPFNAGVPLENKVTVDMLVAGFFVGVLSKES